MGTYNDNLRTTVVASLAEQELALRQVSSALNASMFTLFYAQGAQINDIKKLDATKVELNNKEKVKKQLVRDTNTSNKVVMSSEQEVTFVDAAITNAAVSAADIQVAANAIVQLASDIGSIYSIVNAANYGTNIYEQATRANTLIKATAYHAEAASQLAMEVSYLTAEVPSNSVSNLAKKTHDSISNLLDIAVAAYEKASANVIDDNAVLAEAKAKEKTAESILKNTQVEYYAMTTAYEYMNAKSNYGVRVSNLTEKSFTVSFDQEPAPFEPEESLPGYPVEAYYIMVVKNMNKSTFSSATAEHILANHNQKRFEKIVPDSGAEKIIKTFFIDSQEGTKDTDGDNILLGKDYVIFVFGTYHIKYKKKLNDYTDFLSAPSASFRLTHTLVAPPIDSIKTIPTPTTKTKTSSHPKAIEFRVPKANAAHQVEYRCMFLPYDKDLTAGLLMESDLTVFETKIESIENVEDKVALEIAALEVELIRLKKSKETPVTKILKSIQEELKLIRKRIQAQDAILKRTSISPAERKKAEAAKKKLELAKQKLEREQLELKELYTAEKEAQQVLAVTIEIFEAKLKLLNAAKAKRKQATNADKTGFFFNLPLAENIPIGNYYLPDGNSAIKNKVSLRQDTTDVFGTRLISGNQYLPAILAVSVVPSESQVKYTHALAISETAFTFEASAIS